MRALRDPYNWIDFFRAGVAGYGLLAVGISGSALAELSWAQAGPLVGAQVAVLLIAVSIQMVCVHKGGIFYAPIFFIQGLMFVLVDWRVGLLTMFGLWTLTPLLSTPAPFLVVMGGAAAALGFLLSVPWVYVLAALGVAFWPVLWGILLHKRLVASMERKHLISSKNPKIDEPNTE